MSSRHQSRNNQHERAMEPTHVVSVGRPSKLTSNIDHGEQQKFAKTSTLATEDEGGNYLQREPKSTEELEVPRVRSRTPSHASNDGEKRSHKEFESQGSLHRSFSKRPSKTDTNIVETNQRNSSSSYFFESEEAYQSVNRRYQTENSRGERAKRYPQTEKWHQADDNSGYSPSRNSIDQTEDGNKYLTNRGSHSAYRYEREDEYQYRDTDEADQYHPDRGSYSRRNVGAGKRVAERSSLRASREDADDAYIHESKTHPADYAGQGDVPRRHGPVARKDYYESAQSLDSDFYQYHSGSDDFPNGQPRQSDRQVPHTKERSYRPAQRNSRQYDRSASFNRQDDSETLAWASDENDSELNEQWDSELGGSGSGSILTGRDDPRVIQNTQAQRAPGGFDRCNGSKSDEHTRKLSSASDKSSDNSYKASAMKSTKRDARETIPESTAMKDSTARASTANKGSGVKWSNPITEDEPSDFMRYFSRPDEDGEAELPSSSSATRVQVQTEKSTKVQEEEVRKHRTHEIRSIQASESSDTKEPKKHTPYPLRTDSTSSQTQSEERKHSSYGIRSSLESESSEPKEFKKPYALRTPSEISSSAQNDGAEINASSSGRRLSESSDGRYPERNMSTLGRRMSETSDGRYTERNRPLRSNLSNHRDIEVDTTEDKKSQHSRSPSASRRPIDGDIDSEEPTDDTPDLTQMCLM
ncbi:hypothetical protein BJ742DRAFT_788815, partial [Cladochytrium replicatum]